MRTVIIIPYQNRYAHLQALLSAWEKINLAKIRDNPVSICIAEQAASRLPVPFNRGAIINAGVRLCTQIWKDIHELIIHDVDVIPFNASAYSPSAKLGVVRHYFGRTSSLGGVWSVALKDYKESGGHPNSFWGWGREDNVMAWRMKVIAEVSIDRSIMHDVSAELPKQKDASSICDSNTCTLDTGYDSDGSDEFDEYEEFSPHRTATQSQFIHLEHGGRDFRFERANTQQMRRLMSEPLPTSIIEAQSFDGLFAKRLIKESEIDTYVFDSTISLQHCYINLFHPFYDSRSKRFAQTVPRLIVSHDVIPDMRGACEEVGWRMARGSFGDVDHGFDEEVDFDLGEAFNRYKERQIHDPVIIFSGVKNARQEQLKRKLKRKFAEYVFKSNTSGGARLAGHLSGVPSKDIVSGFSHSVGHPAPVAMVNCSSSPVGLVYVVEDVVSGKTKTVSSLSEIDHWIDEIQHDKEKSKCDDFEFTPIAHATLKRVVISGTSKPAITNNRAGKLPSTLCVKLQAH